MYFATCGFSVPYHCDAGCKWQQMSFICLCKHCPMTFDSKWQIKGGLKRVCEPAKECEAVPDYVFTVLHQWVVIVHFIYVRPLCLSKFLIRKK